MSNKAMTRVWECSQQRGVALLVLLAIADMANDDLICYPGKAHLSRKCRVSVRGLTVILQKLEESGELQIHHRKAGQRNASNIYRLTLHPDSLPLVNQIHYPSESGFTTPGEVDSLPLVNLHSANPLSFKPKKETKEKRDLTPFDLLIAKDEEL